MTSTASSMPWIDNYETREWVVHELPWSNDKRSYPPVCPLKIHFTVCGAESQYAAAHWRNAKSLDGVFYYDMEQMAAGLDTTYGMDYEQPKALAVDWKDHKAGALVVRIFKGVMEGKVTFLVEVT